MNKSPASPRIAEGPLSEDDLTTKARIRNAAFAVIAERGVHGATIRAIASAADVSPALVLHHFRSKQGIEEAVATWALRFLDDAINQLETTADPATAHDQRITRFYELFEENPHLGPYLRSMLLDGSPQGLKWFKGAVDASARGLTHREKTGMARPSEDQRAEAALLLVIGLAPVLLRSLIEHAVDCDFDEAEARARWRRVEVELLTSPVYARAPVRRER